MSKYLPIMILILTACVCTGSGLNGGVVTAPTPLSEYGLDRANTLVLAGGEAETLDPALWTSSGAGIIGDLFSGLVRLGVDLQPVADLAEDWEVSSDGKVYTFHLRQNATFHDGKPFTAEDVRFSWQRALVPDTESATALFYLNDIVGADELAAGETDSLEGVRVIDDHTLEVTLIAPKSFFLHKITFPSTWIVDSENGDDIETNPNGTGPFILDQYLEGDAYILRKNPDYHLGAPSLDNILYRVFAGPSLRLYETGDIDIVAISEDLLARAQDPNDPLYGNVQETNSFCTNYVSFDQSQPPFDDPLVRRAFALAVEMERINDTVFQGKGILARGIYPPGLPGYNAELAGIIYDPEGAAAALRESSYGSAENLPAIIYTTAGAAGQISADDSLYVQMWHEALGVTVTVEALDFSSYLDKVYGSDHGQIVPWGWCADFADPDNFADLFYGGSASNIGNYDNPDFNDLIDQARTSTAADQRIRLYQQAEQILIEDSAAIFTSHSQAYYLVTKPYINGYLATAIGVPQNMDVSITPQVEE